MAKRTGEGEWDHQQQQLCNRNKTKLCVFEDLRNPTLCAKKNFLQHFVDERDVEIDKC